MKKWNEPYLPSLSIYIAQSITACQPVLISSPAQGRRLSWPGWLAFAVIVIVCEFAGVHSEDSAGHGGS